MARFNFTYVLWLGSNSNEILNCDLWALDPWVRVWTKKRPYHKIRKTVSYISHISQIFDLRQKSFSAYASFPSQKTKLSQKRWMVSSTRCPYVSVCEWEVVRGAAAPKAPMTYTSSVSVIVILLSMDLGVEVWASRLEFWPWALDLVFDVRMATEIWVLGLEFWL